MKLVKVELTTQGRATLEFEAPESRLEPDFNEVVLPDFEGDYESMSTDYLYVRAADAPSLVIACAEWMMTPISDQDQIERANRFFEELAALKAKVDSIYNQIQKTPDFHRELIIPYSTPNPSHNSSVNAFSPRCESSRALTACSESSAKLRRRHSDASIDLQKNLTGAEAGEERVLNQSTESASHEPSTIIGASSQNSRPDTSPMIKYRPKCIKIQYNNPNGASKTSFHVTTVWKNVTWSRAYLCSLASPNSNYCTISDLLKINQNTEIDWLNCSLEVALGSARSLFHKMKCPRGKPLKILLTSFQAQVIKLGASDTREWGLRLNEVRTNRKDNSKFLPGIDIVLYIAGKLEGTFETTLTNSNFSATIEKLKPVDTITKPAIVEQPTQSDVKTSDTENGT